MAKVVKAIDGQPLNELLPFPATLNQGKKHSRGWKNSRGKKTKSLYFQAFDMPKP